MQPGDSLHSKSSVGMEASAGNPPVVSPVPYLEIAGLTEGWDILLRAKMKHQLRGNTLKG